VFPSIYVKKFGLIFCGKHFPEEIRDIHKKWYHYKEIYEHMNLNNERENNQKWKFKYQKRYGFDED
jgi:hypothetical protein